MPPTSLRSSPSSPSRPGHERLRPLRALYPRLHLRPRVGEPARHPGGRGRGNLQHRGPRPSYRADRIGKNRGGVLPHTHRVLGGPARQRGRHLHRPHEGADQRPVLPPHRSVRGGGHPRVALARRRLGLPQGKAHEEALRDPAAHAGVARGHPHAAALCRGQALLRFALRRHRRGPLTAARRPRRAVPMPHRAAQPHGGRRPPAHRAFGDHRRPGGRGRVSCRRHRATHHRPARRGAAPHLAPVDGALLHHRSPGVRVPCALARWRRGPGRGRAGGRTQGFAPAPRQARPVQSGLFEHRDKPLGPR